MEKKIIATDKVGNVVMEMTDKGLIIKGDIEIKENDPTEEFIGFLFGMKNRITELEKQVEEFKAKVDISKYKWDKVDTLDRRIENIISHIQASIDIKQSTGTTCNEELIALKIVKLLKDVRKF